MSSDRWLTPWPRHFDACEKILSTPLGPCVGLFYQFFFDNLEKEPILSKWKVIDTHWCKLSANIKQRLLLIAYHLLLQVHIIRVTLCSIFNFSTTLLWNLCGMFLCLRDVAFAKNSDLYWVRLTGIHLLHLHYTQVISIQLIMWLIKTTGCDSDDLRVLW